MMTDGGRALLPCALPTSLRCWVRWPCAPWRSRPSPPGSIRIRRRSRCMGPMRRRPVQGTTLAQRRPHRSLLGRPRGTAQMGTRLSSRGSCVSRLQRWPPTPPEHAQLALPVTARRRWALARKVWRGDVVWWPTVTRTVTAPEDGAWNRA
jgi:hypothetical protein